MVKSNQNGKENDKIKISPLGIEEINSVIKSFKNSSFNEENLYKKGPNNFVKKTLFELAKESEKDELEKNQSKDNLSISNDDFENNVDNTKEDIIETDYENKLSDTDLKNDFNNEDQNIEKDIQIESNNDDNKLDKVSEEKIVSENSVLQNEKIKVESTLEQLEQEKIDGENLISDKIIENQIDNDNQLNQKKALDLKTNDPNKVEYEEKTLEALDSVREAVTKSLEENNDVQNDEIKNNIVSSKINSNDAISEINFINTLFKNIRQIANEEIENVVKSKVIELAEGVIGYQIEKFPEKFLKKIKNSIDEIKSINDDIKIFLSEQDFEILNKFVESHKAETNFKLDLDTSLGRGDFTIDLGGVVQSIKYKKVIE